MVPRSFLFVPADRPDRYATALASGADAVIVDLEDAVAPDAKVSARLALTKWLSEEHPPVIIRINGVETEWFSSDLTLCALPGVAGVVIPKAEREPDLSKVATASPGRSLYPLVETAAGFEAVRTLARCPTVRRLIFGSIDFQLDLGIYGDGDELLFFRSELVLASRLAGLLAPVDGVSPSIADAAQLDLDTARARRLGFGAKLCIHPTQVDAVNAGFTPSPAVLRWAERVLAAAEAAHGAAVQVDGKMVDKPVLLRAQALIEAWQEGIAQADLVPVRK